MKQTSHYLVILSGILLLAGCRKETVSSQNESTLPAVPVTVLKVEAKEYPATEDVVGTLRAKRKTSVEAKVSGRIQDLTVQVGDAVASGALLARLDVQEIQARLDQALAQREQARGDLKRMSGLLKERAITQQEFDAVQARERITSASVAEAETMLGYAKITAPFAGVITRKLAENGDLAAPGKALVEIEDPTSLRFEADVPEMLLAQIRAGTAMTIQLPALKREVTGVVTEVAPVADAISRTFRVKYDVPASVDLRAGLFGRVAIPLSPVRAIRVPAGAVRRRGQLEYVFVLHDTRANLRLVKTGAVVAGDIEIVSGLEGGESIAAGAAGPLTDGQTVTLR